MGGSRKPGPLGRSSKAKDPNHGNMIRSLSPRPDRISSGPTSITGHRPKSLRTIPPKPARQTTAATTIQVLRQGSQGSEVQKLQRLLNVRLVPSPKLAVDGIFGPLTLQAVLQYQRGVSITADGVVGKQTWYHLLKDNKATVVQPPIRPPQPSNTGSSVTPKIPTSAPSPRASSPPAVGIWEWPLQDKFAEALRRTAPKLPKSMRHEFEALLSPTSLAIMAGTLVVWAGSHAFGVGEIVDVVLLIGGAIFLGMAVFDVASELGDFLVVTSSATEEKELDEAASHLARAIAIIGVAAFVALLAKVAKGRGGGKTGAPETPPKPVAEPTAPRPKASPKAEQSEPPPKPKRPAEPIASSNVVKSKAGHTYDMTPGDPSKPARFGQRGVSPNFSKEGRFKGANIDSVVEKLKNGELQPSDVPVDYIWVNGEKVVVNNRSATTLSKAGIPQEKWVMNDKTGMLPPSGPDSLPSVLERLDEMGGKPADSMPIRETGDRSGPIKEVIPVSK